VEGPEARLRRESFWQKANGRSLTREKRPQISNSDAIKFSFCCRKGKREIWDDREKQVAALGQRRLSDARGGAVMSAGLQTLTFQHRFRSGALCQIEVNLAEVKSGTFTPNFTWRGHGHKPREMIAWVLSAFRIVANRTGERIVHVFIDDDLKTETWVIPPNEKPRRIAQKAEPGKALAAAMAVAALAKFATQQDLR
jgi:hypothetical protein